MGTVINKRDTLISTTWFAGTNKGLRCSVPGCEHIGEVITKAHCRIAHNMERTEVAKQYGMPVVVESKGEILSHNNGRSKWYSTANGMGAL